MRKAKYAFELKIKVVKEYEAGKGTIRSLAAEYGMSRTSVEDWIRKYYEQGEVGLMMRRRNSAYSSAFKVKCVQAVLRGEGSVNDIVARYNISSRGVLLCWIQRYNANKELKDYDPKQEVYMASARRKTTLEERKEIVEYCIAHGKDYKGTASFYDVSYSQVYTWVRKYLSEGEDALLDKRGHHKTDDEVDELERLRRENARLRQKLEEQGMIVELLKKVKEFEGR